MARLRATHPEIWQSVSLTTRAPRPGEVDGLHYLFCDDADLRRGGVAGASCWSGPSSPATATGRRGPPSMERLERGEPVLLEIELEGARQVRRDACRTRCWSSWPRPRGRCWRGRLTGRGTEDELVIARRLARARVELAAAPEFDVILVNDDVHEVCERLVALMRSDEDLSV